MSNYKICEYCGKQLETQNIEALGHKFTHTVECECYIARREAETQENIKCGCEIIRAKMRELSGIPNRYIKPELCYFRPKPGQENALSAAQKFIEAWREVHGNNQTGLIFAGSVGCGKTMLASAIANDVIQYANISVSEAEHSGQFGCPQSYVSPPVLFVSTVELMERIRATYNPVQGSERPQTAQDILSKYKRVPVLVLDDLGAEKSTE